MFQTNDLAANFEEISENGWTLLPLSEDFLKMVYESLQQRLQQDEFKSAKLSHSNDLFLNIRNDQTYWLNANEDQSLSISEKQILTELEELQIQLKTYFRIHLSEVECHYARYPVGHFYKKHFDTTLENNRRQFSFVIYLNKNWKKSDEGHLIGYAENKILFQVPPKWGQMILFRSNIEHEVEPTQAERLSLTGWFRS